MEPDLFRRRRAALMARLGDGAAIFPSPPEARRNGDVEHPFRPDSDVHYLTGFEEPGAVCLLAPHHPEHKFILFVRPRDPEMETWTGRRAGVEGAVERFGADAAHPIGALEQELPRYLAGASRLVVRLGDDPEWDRRLLGILAGMRRRARAGVRVPLLLADPQSTIHEMRLIKGPEEIDLLRRSVEVTAEAHLWALRHVRAGMNEGSVQAEIEAIYRRAGGRFGPGYCPIVAGGPNATVLHYNDNRDPLREGELLLIDSGAEIDCYTADVTRTFPVGRAFSPAQRELYDLVLAAADASLAEARPGATLDGLHDAAVRVLTEGMVRVGLLRGSVEENIQEKKFRRFYMHRTGHWLGKDVHDAGAYYGDDGQPRPLAPGMVFTIEPGLYVAPGDAEAPERFRGIGIRIEDDIALGERGAENLTRHIPRTAAEVERERARAFA